MKSLRGVGDLLQVIKQNKEHEIVFTQRLNEIKSKQAVVEMKLQELNGGANNGVYSNSR